MKFNGRAHPAWPPFNFSCPVFPRLFYSAARPAAILAVLLLCAPGSRAQSNFFPRLDCKNRTYTNATIDFITPATVTIFWDGGGERIPITNLPPELLARCHYDAQAAQEYVEAQAAKKAARQERAEQELAALAKARSTLGPAQTIRIVKIISDLHLQIEADGKVTAACIHHLPPTILASFRELNETKAEVAALEAQVAQDQHAAAHPVSNAAAGSFNSRIQRAAAARAQRNAGGAARTAAASDTAALAKLKSRLKELEARATFTACPSDYMTSGGVRLWEYQPAATAGLTAK